MPRVTIIRSAASSTAATASPCPATGLWALCSVEKRLTRAGLVPRKSAADTLPRAGFSVRPVVYEMGRGSRLEVFIYSSEAALIRDVARLDTLKVAPIGSPGAWSKPPLFIRSGNLAAVLLTDDAREADRVSLALTAGAPRGR